MNTAALYHRPESEFAYLYTQNEVHVRVRAAKEDIKKVTLIYGDPYSWSTSGVGNADNQDTQNVWLSHKKVMQKLATTETSDYFEAKVSVPTKRLDYVFVVEGADGEKIILTDKGVMPYKRALLISKYGAFRLPYFHEVDRFQAPEWAHDRVWYQIFPERFANGDTSNDPENVKAWTDTAPDRQDFYGGDLQGVLDHLDHLSTLGVNGIYFCPVFKASTNHKYDTEDYLAIDPHFGDKKLFKKVIDAAHARGIKVMLDAVFNHIGDTSPQWQDVLENQERSRYKDWFHINSFPVVGDEAVDNAEVSENLSYDTFAFTPHMPKLNTANAEVQAYLLEIAAYWIREFDIDAWRLDVADEVDHAFWKKFRAVCDAAKDDFYILGEVWHSAQPWLVGDEFSAVMNYTYTGAIEDYFLTHKLTLSQMIATLNEQLMLYRKQTSQVMFNVLDSHDTPRVLTVAKGDKDLMRQVEAFTYLQPGVPCIYYGDEFAMTGGMDPDCRKPMVWAAEKQDHAMFAFFKELVAFRKMWARELAESELDWLRADEKSGLIELRRGALSGVFNTGKKAVSYDKRGKVQLSQLTADGKIAPKGFVIFR
ncbi:MAG: glycoside hydrolase family 13 protein [Streptococcaceae bacterium]|jgi:neopullulanase|nr:glycoside hydrolase family 13 protein [Streptococcaceae bacterium]